MTTSPRRARVSATLVRRTSARKPTSPSMLLRTSDSTTASFSRPWKPSTLSISSPGTSAKSPRRPRPRAGVGADDGDPLGAAPRRDELPHLPRGQVRLLRVEPALAVGLLLLVVAGPGGVDEGDGGLGQRRRLHPWQVAQ